MIIVIVRVRVRVMIMVTVRVRFRVGGITARRHNGTKIRSLCNIPCDIV